MPNCKQSLISKLISQQKGSVVIVVAVMLFLIIAILMVTVDLSRVQSGKTNNQAALDASVLGAAEYITRHRVIAGDRTSPDDYKEYAKKILVQNLSKDQSDAMIAQHDEAGNLIDDFDAKVGGTIRTPTGQEFTAGPDEVVVYACLTVKTGFAKSAGAGDDKKVCGYSKATLPGLSNVEVVFALDVSYSMLEKCDTCGSNLTKIEALRNSIKNVMGSYSTNNSIYWGVVPYTGMVDLGNMASTIVENDLAAGQPTSELNENVVFPMYWDDNKIHNFVFHYYFNGVEQQVGYGGGIIFDTNDYVPYALDSLIRIPLTSRIGDDNFGNIEFDDAPPATGGKFMAYWYQPYDFFKQYSNPIYNHDYSNETPGVCGTCYDKQVGAWEYTNANTGEYIERGTCEGDWYDICRDPTVSHPAYCTAPCIYPACGPPPEGTGTNEGSGK